MFTFPVGFFNLIVSGGGGGTTDPFAANVVLFLKGDGTNGSTNIVDSSPTPKTISVFGNAQISTAQSKYGGSSLLFDGSGDYLTTTALNLVNVDFTVEYWIYVPTTKQGIVFSSYNFPNQANTFITHTNLNGRITGSNGIVGVDTSVVTNNNWIHYAVTYQQTSTQLRIYLNGVLSATGIAPVNSQHSTCWIGGAPNDNNLSGWWLHAYIDSLRVTRGVVRYTANFNPETDTYLDIPTPTPTDPNFANRLLLLHGDGANNSTTFADSSSFNRTITASGSPIISTAASQFGGSSISFNGSSRLLVASSSSELILGSSDFTFEGFIRPNSYSGFPTLFENRDAFAVRGYSCFFDGSGTLYFYASDGSNWLVTMATSVAVATGEFTYFKITRNGSSWSISLNGTVRATQTSTLTIVGEAASALTLGGTVNGGQYNGYLDEFRMSNIFESGSVVPTSPFPNS